METLIVNLFAGPGTGKSTIAAGLFYRLKIAGINCEYVQEYAKDRTWQEDWTALQCQPYIAGKQMFRVMRLLGKVDVVITDSPLLLSLVYPSFGSTPAFDQWVLEAFALFNNLNIFLERDPEKHRYNASGRSQSEDEAMVIDQKVRGLLTNHSIEHSVVRMNGEETLNEILEKIHKVLEAV
jgi:hypothetical protein